MARGQAKTDEGSPRRSILLWIAVVALTVHAALAFHESIAQSATMDEVVYAPAGETEWTDAVVNRPIAQGDRLWTDRGAGLLHLTLAPGERFFATLPPEAGASLAHAPVVHSHNRTIQSNAGSGYCDRCVDSGLQGE